MKRRVRIYKPTNKFQSGGEQGTQFTPDQLVSIYMTALSEPGSSVEDAEEALRQSGVDEDTIASITENAGEYIDNEQYMNKALTTSDEDELTDITADQAAEDAAYQEEQDALAAAEEEARSDAMQQMYANYSQSDYSDDADLATELIQRNGGVPSKRSFIRNVLNQVKKQAGGESEPASIDSTDPDNKRKERLQNFTKAIQVEGDLKLAKEDAKKAYEMLTTPIGQEESYYESPDMDYAQFGGMRRGQQRRMDRRMNRMIRKMPINFYNTPGGLSLPGVYNYSDLMNAYGLSQMPAQGSYYSGPKLANIDVRRTGLFGRPKEYTITFADDIVNNPQTRENTIKQEIKNKEEEIKDEIKAAEEGTVDQGVEEKKAEEADVNINDIQVVSGSNRPSVSKKGTRPSNRPATTQSSSTKSKAPIVKKPGAKPVYDSFGSGPRYTITDTNPRPLPQEIKKYVYGPKGQSMADYAWDYVTSGNVFDDMGNSIKEKLKGLSGYFNPVNMNRPVSKSAPRQRIDMGDKFQFGGFSDEDSGLYKFVYGGDDEILALPPTGGKLVNSPYFAYGGIFETAGETDSTIVDILDVNGNVVRQGTLAEAERTGLRHRVKQSQPQSQTQQTTTNTNTNTNTNTYSPFITKQKGLPYLTGSKDIYKGDFKNPQLKSINVKKTRAFGPYKGMPKKYTLNFQVEQDPLSKRMSFDQSGMKIDGRPMSEIAPTRQGLFNRKGYIGARPDTAFESRSRALSWLGSKLGQWQSGEDNVSSNQPLSDYSRAERKMIRKGYDPNTGLTEEQLRNREFNKQLAFSPPEITDVDWSDSLPIPDQVPQSELTPVNPRLEPGISGPKSMEQMREDEVQPEPYNIFNVPFNADDYYFDQQNNNDQETQDFMLEQMARQNPDYFNQDVYNWQPDLTGSENIGLNLNPPIVTPESYIEAKETSRVEPTKRTTLSNRVVPKSTVPKRTAPSPVVQNRQSPSPVIDTNKTVKPVVKTTPKPDSTIKPKEEKSVQYVTPTGPKEIFNNPERAQRAADQVKNEINQQRQQLENQRKRYLDTYGVDKATLNMYRNLMTMPGTEALRRQMRNTYPGLKKYYKSAYGGDMAYGGTLPQAVIGEDTPINQDERFIPSSQKFTTLNKPGLSNPMLSSGKNPLTGQESGVKMGTDGKYVNEGVIPKDELPDFSNIKETKDVSVDFNNKRELSNEDYIAGLNLFNYGANALLSKIGERGDADRERQMADRLKADALYGSTGQYDRGDYEANSGLWRPDEMGFTARDGGYMYEEGGETWMSEDDIRKFLEEGGELEFV